MRLNVLPNQSQAWYARGLRFSCTQCGNCCSGAPGNVWISIEEVHRLAAHLQIDPQEVIDRYCRKIDGKLSLRERRNAHGQYDCIFLEEHKPVQRSSRKQAIMYSKRICSIYPSRPLQCRTWPFWPENLMDEARWERAGKRCPGIGTGKKYSADQVMALRDARDWPEESSGRSG